MGIDYFPTRDLTWKIAMLEAVQEAMFTGNVSKAQTAPGVITEFDPKTMSPDTMQERLVLSVIADDDFDPDNDPVHAKILLLQRPGITRPRFG